MDAPEFKKSFIEDVKTKSAATGDGNCATFTDDLARYLIEADALSDFTPAFYTGKYGRQNCRVDGYAYDETDNTMNLIYTYFDLDVIRKETKSIAKKHATELKAFLSSALHTDLYMEIEESTSASDLIDLVREKKEFIRRYRFFIFTNADVSQTLKNMDPDEFEGVPVEIQVWGLDRLFQIVSSSQGRQTIEIDFREYCDEGIPCLEASLTKHESYTSYLGVIPASVLADIYDKYGSRLMEGNVRSFLSTKVAVNKKIRKTILTEPELFFAFNNGISVTASNVKIRQSERGKFITYTQDLQIINGGQTTASLALARYKDKADLSKIYVQMKMTVMGEVEADQSDSLIANISKASNQQNKVSEADFFASHPFHRKMEQISRTTFAPAAHGQNYETKWFYERARGQYLQEQFQMKPSEKKAFELQNPKKQVITKTDLAKYQNCWRGFPYIVSKGAQTNFKAFAGYVDEKWSADEEAFNKYYYQQTVALNIMFRMLETEIPHQSWYEGGYRANIIYYTIALFRKLVMNQFKGSDFDLMRIWNRQRVPRELEKVLLPLAHLVMNSITDEKRQVKNVTEWCKREECWKEVQKITMYLPQEVGEYTIRTADQKSLQDSAKKEQKMVDGINAQTEVVKITGTQWGQLARFAVDRGLISPSDANALKVAVKIPARIPTEYQCRKLLTILDKAVQEGFTFL